MTLEKCSGASFYLPVLHFIRLGGFYDFLVETSRCSTFLLSGKQEYSGKKQKQTDKKSDAANRSSAKV